MIQIKNLSKRYGSTYVLRDVSFTVDKGSICGLFGVNGAGKSTLLKILCGLELETAGELFCDDQKFVPGKYPLIGAMIEEPCFYSNMSGFDNLNLLAKLSGQAEEEDVLNALHTVGLDNKKDTRVKEYSLGMKQRLYFASAIMRNVDLLLLDEPFNGIDPIALSSLEKLIVDLAAQGKTIIISSHVIRELQVLVDKAVFLNKGKLVFENNDAHNIDIFREFLTRVENSDAQ